LPTLAGHNQANAYLNSRRAAEICELLRSFQRDATVQSAVKKADVAKFAGRGEATREHVQIIQRRE
jgi:hypothetical protein